MSIAIKRSKKIISSLFIITALTCQIACEKENSKITYSISNVQNFRSSKMIDANNLVTLANLNKKTIETNKKLGLESSNKRIENFSNLIDKNQNDFLKSITDISNSKLIILNSILKIDNYIKEDSIRNEKIYFVTVQKQIETEISLLDQIQKTTNDSEIKEFAFENLKKQYHILNLIKDYKSKIINNSNIQINNN